MERLTYYENGEACIKIGGTVYKGLDFVKRFAAFEDTGLTPDEVMIQRGYVEGMKENLRTMYGDTSVQRLMELAKADREGRCVVHEKTCDTCAHGDELKTEQPCCGCVDCCNWEAGEA